MLQPRGLGRRNDDIRVEVAELVVVLHGEGEIGRGRPKAAGDGSEGRGVAKFVLELCLLGEGILVLGVPCLLLLEKNNNEIFFSERFEDCSPCLLCGKKN